MDKWKNKGNVDGRKEEGWKGDGGMKKGGMKME